MIQDATTPEDRLQALGIELPEAAAPVANYVPWVQSGSLVTFSGQLPMKDGCPAFLGRVGDGVSVDEGAEAARLCAINLIAQIRNACGPGGLSRVRAVIRLGGFVASGPDFMDHPKVINGASDLVVAVFGAVGRHARSAVGVSSLPLGVPVELEAQIALHD